MAQTAGPALTLQYIPGNHVEVAGTDSTPHRVTITGQPQGGTPSMIKTTLRTHLWFETSGGMFFGMGRVLLIQKVKELGSLNKAAKELGMSYRAAWGKIKASEEVLGKPLLVKVEGRKGFVLSDAGETLLKSFFDWQNEVETYALQQAQKHFPWKIQVFESDQD